VGTGNAVVEVVVDTVTETESILERRIDPDSRVAISTEVEERESAAQDSNGGAVTVASNLPDGDAGAESGGTQSTDAETRTITNYELSETSRELVRVPGDVRRLSVAVLVNDIVTTAADGTQTTTPRSEEEMSALGELVASAVGLDAARGDVMTIRAMTFQPIALAGTEGVLAGPFLDLMGLIKIGVLAGVALILGLFVLRPILASGRKPPLLADYSGPVAALPGPQAQRAGAAPEMILDAAPDRLAVPEAEIVDPVTRLRRLIEARQDETIQILHDWIEEPGRKERA